MKQPQTSELPDGNPKTAQGAKKTPLVSVIPAPPLLQVGEVMRLGRAKYGPYNWRNEPVTASTYIDATLRHLFSWWDGETIDPESGVSHLAHAAASLFVIMDALATGHATDDRPETGVAAELIQVFAKRREVPAPKAPTQPDPSAVEDTLAQAGLPRDSISTYRFDREAALIGLDLGRQLHP